MKRLPLFDAICLSISTICGLTVIVFALTGCKFFGAEPSAPSAFERHFFDIQTNYVARVVLATNTVLLTNVVTEFRTNTVGQIVLHTNEIVLPTYNLITITQQVAEHTLTVKTNQPAAQGAGAVANAIIPGSGGAVTGAILMGLGLWAKLRSRKKANINLAQGSEMLLELLQLSPDGDQQVAAAKQMLQKSQAEDGVSKEVRTVLSEEVSKGDAKAAASEIKSTVAKFKV